MKDKLVALGLVLLCMPLVAAGLWFLCFLLTDWTGPYYDR
jgi:hypothetical protein